METCPACDGTKVDVIMPLGGDSDPEVEPCMYCNGKGMIGKEGKDNGE